MHPWFATLNPVPLEDLKSIFAKRFAGYVQRFGGDTVRVTQALSDDDSEVILIELSTGCGQRPRYPFKRVEPLGISFRLDMDCAPLVLSLRADFPDTPHQNWTFEGFPFSLCIDDRPWVEARITFTDSELVQRILNWFQGNARGTLHGETQPLDPTFIGGSISLILPDGLFESAIQDKPLRATARGSDREGKFLILDFATPQEGEQKTAEFLFVPIEVAPEQMARLRQAPTNLLSLARELAVRGCDVISILKSEILNNWKTHAQSKIGIVLKMPICHPGTGEVRGTSFISFLLGKPIGELGVVLGVLDPCPGLKIGYGPILGQNPIDEKLLEEIKLAVCPVYQSFSPQFAAKLAGRDEDQVLSAVLIGAGAVGSLVTESLVREARLSLSIVDSDVLLPHNLARHSLGGWALGHSKATALAFHFEKIMPSLKATGASDNILNGIDPALQDAFSSAEVILDASASVPVGRFLSDMKISARRVCFFYNAAGTMAALLVEDSERSVDLRCLEASMYAAVLDGTGPFDFWRVPAEMMTYSGNCSALTTRIAASQVQTLAGLIARGIGQALASPDPQISFWSLDREGNVKATKLEPRPALSNALAEWKIRILPQIKQQIMEYRQAHLPNETGGALLGVVDIPSKQIEVVALLPAPEDSVGTPDGFTRGVKGLYEQVMDAIGQCNNQIRYVGEWHSHPAHTSTAQSGTDVRQLAVLTESLSWDGCPGVQLIGGDLGIETYLGIIAD